MGRGRHYGIWEVADIGLILVFRRKGKILRSKMVYLQSKNLYADPLKYNESVEERYYGLGSLLMPEQYHNELVADKVYMFTTKSKYQAFSVESEQQQAMKAFQDKFKMTMHYMLYNPLTIPMTMSVPYNFNIEVPHENEVGCRIMRKDHLAEALKSYGKGYIPTYGDISNLLPIEFYGEHTAGWKLEYFIADLMMQCKEGIIDDSPNFETLYNMMSRKDRIMSTGVMFTFDVDE
ncbi:hypothetical protein [Mucilaginibacter sp. BT774]|uniref:hypothetical protein n=1 Tax=Mucilaginibacter sp. BT774 TaxID=3062276 RepID=UPI002674B04A|nr:hypothetical protein [Mucilaginibacter sp. BT774]MDO3627658.1 hypothetical protein [Mucilaginibacter sp. BT774]